MPARVPATAFEPEIGRSYGLPPGVWWLHVGEWRAIDGPGCWVLALDATIDMPLVSRVMDVLAYAMGVLSVIQWAVGRQLQPHGSA